MTTKIFNNILQISNYQGAHIPWCFQAWVELIFLKKVTGNGNNKIEEIALTLHYMTKCS